MKHEAARQIVCAENVSLLHLLHKVPEQPSANTLPDAEDGPGRYTLPLAKERVLASSLAFLSSISDDFSRITAVCLQEVQNDGTLEVLVAINKQEVESGSGTLGMICSNFAKLFERLSRVGEGTHSCARPVCDPTAC